jgi:galactokinase/mevalonate kinase-like predicted kinase
VLGLAIADDLESGDWSGIAEALWQTTELLAHLNQAIVDSSMHQLLVGMGASGGKPCGAGGPGAVWLVMVAPEARCRFEDACLGQGLAVSPVVVARRGVRTWKTSEDSFVHP